MFESTFYVTITFLLGSAVLSTLLRRLKRDECLSDLDGSPVHVHYSGKEAPDKARIFVVSGGFQLQCVEFTKQGERKKRSFLLYKDELDDVHYLVRYCDELSPAEREYRDAALAQLSNPPLSSRIWRLITTWLNILRDSFLKVIDLALAQWKKSTSHKLMARQHPYINDTARELMNFVAYSYEPLLERNIGRKVSLLYYGTESKDPLVFKGILKEYTERFVSLLDHLTREEALSFEIRHGAVTGNEGMEVRLEKGRLSVRNLAFPFMKLERLHGTKDSTTQPLDGILEQGAAVTITLDDGIKDPSHLVIDAKVRRRADYVFSRKRGIVRWIEND